MQSTTKFQAGGPFHKLKSAFTEIYGKLNDPLKPEMGTGKQTARSEQEKVQ